jgi:enamine deaminase RidA (YjgF/YER057c/UK114 family)
LVRRDIEPWGDALAYRYPRLPYTEPRTECLDNRLVWRHESVRIILTKAGPGQAFLVAQTGWGADAAPAAQAAYGEIARILQVRGMTVVHERLFGSLTVKPAVMAARSVAFSARNLPVDGPLTYIQGAPPWGEGFAGVIIQAVSGDEVWTIKEEGKNMGRGWRRGNVTFLLLQDLHETSPNDNRSNARSLQTRQLIQHATHLLETQGASYRDVARTWFYLSDILAWYPEFNQARCAVYRELALIPGNGDSPRHLPASTGIRGEVSTGAAGALDLLAVVGPLGSRPPVQQLSNPGQQDAFQYGSAFFRGALIRQPDLSMIQVSGTAAIDERGHSLFPDDAQAQIDCTFEKIAALIGQEGGEPSGYRCSLCLRQAPRGRPGLSG